MCSIVLPRSCSIKCSRLHFNASMSFCFRLGDLGVEVAGLCRASLMLLLPGAGVGNGCKCPLKTTIIIQIQPGCFFFGFIPFTSFKGYVREMSPCCLLDTSIGMMSSSSQCSLSSIIIYFEASSHHSFFSSAQYDSRALP